MKEMHYFSYAPETGITFVLNARRRMKEMHCSITYFCLARTLVLNARRRMKEMHTFGSTSLLTIGYHHSLHAPLVFPLNYSA